LVVDRGRDPCDIKTMMKTKTYTTFTGDSASVTFELVKRSDYWSILRVAKDGVSTQNKWGGWPTVNSGSPAYITRKWKHVAE
jgi:hypothetical protein